MQKEPVDLREAVRQALEACAPAVEAKHLTIDVALPDAPVVMLADPARLVQIVTNLLSNAVKFTPRDGAARLMVREDGGTAVLRLEDEGIGISPEMLPRVFEMFTQADTSLDRTSGGLGVGLALARHLVESHGGEIAAESAGLGKGTAFTVRLPVLDPHDRRATTLAAVSGSKRIAVVEDNPDTRLLLAEVLEAAGFAVLTAENGEQALQLAEQERPSAYVIDLGLPGMDGFELARRIRQTTMPKRALLIALSGYGSPEHQARAFEAGFDHHMTKPADLDALERLLRADQKGER